MTSKSPAVFISYRRTDTSWFAAMLCSRIKQRLPALDVFLDVASIEPGVAFEAALTSALNQTKVLLALIGQGWLTAQDDAGRRRIDLETDWVRTELGRALDSGIRVIPILVDGAKMPRPEYLPPALSALSSRQSRSVTFEAHEEAVAGILESLSKMCHVPFVASSSTPEPLALAPSSATAVLGLFESDSTDNETLTVLAERQLDRGRFALARAIFELIVAREVKLLRGCPELDALRAKYQVARANLLLGQSEAAATELATILPYIERERDECYPLYVKAQAALARAHLECGRNDAARAALPTSRAALFADQSLTAIDAWLAHLEGRLPSRDQLLQKLDRELEQWPPTPEFARSPPVSITGETPTFRIE